MRSAPTLPALMYMSPPIFQRASLMNHQVLDSTLASVGLQRLPSLTFIVKGIHFVTYLNKTVIVVRRWLLIDLPQPHQLRLFIESPTPAE
ncbi:hypothetical protein PIB30_010628 [Stylosanthes scabra]|uniref:Uncharacterized protein n=1 Tax=Stylosanthes scabra TaxID=79078 RepID=A0ABU6U4D9_9FABA|nr:hypothetical protein [Stylosanthes scabra]